MFQFIVKLIKRHREEDGVSLSSSDREKLRGLIAERLKDVERARAASTSTQ